MIGNKTFIHERSLPHLLLGYNTSQKGGVARSILLHGNGSTGGGTVVPAGKEGRSRLIADNPSSEDMNNLNLARSLIMAYQCQPGDQWFWVSGTSGQTSYCSCN